MKQTSFVIGLAMLVASTSVGCKSAPKMAWWKSKDAAEATAMAHQAPELPSDAAKKAEAKSSSTQVAGGVAAPFVPGAAAGGSTTPSSNYPTTDAPAFTPNAVAQTTPASAGASGPYNPAATPVGKAAPVAVATTGVDRYGASDPAAAVQQGLAAGYSATKEVAANAVNSAADVESRYGTPAADAAATYTSGVAAVTPYSPAPVTPASSVVATQPYRPGGTSTYSVPSMASLPPSSTPPTATTSTTPATTTPASAPTSNRYW